jgi:probable DNA repair protein
MIRHPDHQHAKLECVMSIENQQKLTLCATDRLARSMRQHLQTQIKHHGLQQWQPQAIFTLHQWLESYISYACLTSDIDANTFSPNTLDNFTEALLWQQAIQSCLNKHEYKELFDVPSLANAAITANKMMIDWQISESDLNQQFNSIETRQFLHWRNAFFKLCEKHETVTPAWRLLQLINALPSARYPLPSHIRLMGFDRMTPLELHLIDILKSKGVTLEKQQMEVQNAQHAQIGLQDLNAECLAAVAWAKQHLEKNPDCQLAIISPIQSMLRRSLSDLLDDTFHPETLFASQYEAPRIYDFSVGNMLSETTICRTALNLLRLTSTHQPVSQSDMSALLLDVYWGDLAEFDERSLVDARMRKKLMRSIKLDHLIELIDENDSLTQLYTHLKSIQTTQESWTKNQTPSHWAREFISLLQRVNWAQTRPLSSHEYQAKSHWGKSLESFAALDLLTGKISASDALHQLTRLVRNKMFIPEAVGKIQIQLLGMLENLSHPIDAIWVMGMNDHLWPPPANLNPLLPATLQRRLQTPGANPDTQSAFAQLVHTRICNSANEVIFSWSHKDGERELRVSPTLANIARLNSTKLVSTMAESLAQPYAMQLLDDNLAPQLLDTEKLRGGSQLLAAQAICPAWAFYQFRLGANALEEPSDGLDSMVRGNLVHAALQYFWTDCSNSENLKQISQDAIETKIKLAIDKGMQTLKQELPTQLILIEEKRLQQLILAWLSLETEREDFTVKACEASYTVTIAGLEIDCRIDRIDQLADDSLVIIDYKTGSSDPKTASWASERIKEPQLPIYASIALKDNIVVAVCFAKVHIEGCKLSGLSQNTGLPGITPFQDLKSNSPFKHFDNFSILITHWRDCLEKIADEIRLGQASVVFEDENDLMYCKVKPLLRLPERQLQYEMQRTNLQCDAK